MVKIGLRVFLSSSASSAGQHSSVSFFRSSLFLSSGQSHSLRSDSPAMLCPRPFSVWMNCSPSRRRRRATLAWASSRLGVSKYWLNSSQCCQPLLLRFFSSGCSRRAVRVARLARSLISVSLTMTGGSCPYQTTVTTK
ncbi:hypothetical protein D9M71_561370 [compost metagenome]